MKYIKQFEFYHELADVDKLLKYFAYKGSLKYYTQFTIRIYEILSIQQNNNPNKTTLTIKAIADYNTELKNYKKNIPQVYTEPINIHLFEIMKENILYTSNDLEDIKTMIPVLLDTKNYNL